MQTRQVSMRRWSIISPKPFDVVVAAVEEAIGRPNMIEFVANLTAATSYEEMQKVVQDSVSEIGLKEFMRLDHGAVLVKAGVGGNLRSLRLIMGNPLIMLAILAVRIGLERFHLPFSQAGNSESWCCAQPGNQNKDRILAMLRKTGGKHLVIVEPKNDPDNLLQWIYNQADIDASPVVWARDLGAEKDRALVEYFRGRSVWLVDPNVQPARITPYQVTISAKAR